MWHFDSSLLRQRLFLSLLIRCREWNKKGIMRWKQKYFDGNHILREFCYFKSERMEKEKLIKNLFTVQRCFSCSFDLEGKLIFFVFSSPRTHGNFPNSQSFISFSFFESFLLTNNSLLCNHQLNVFIMNKHWKMFMWKSIRSWLILFSSVLKSVLIDNFVFI